MATQWLQIRLTSRSSCGTALLNIVFIASSSRCLGEWTKTINCSSAQVYRDVQQDAGREEFCERSLPGSLVVKDGPYRSWFSEGHPGSEGRYLNGREVGRWKECDRFDRCNQLIHEAVFPEEKRRPAFMPHIPVRYELGKYVFDFASCRSTWVTKSDELDPISLNIGGGGLYRCQISYLPESVMRHGGKGDYVCRVPFALGTRAFDSIDLQMEFTKARLPQFCRSVDTMGEPLLIRRGPAEVATTVDVTCATLKYASPNTATLELKLNRYAKDLVTQASRDEGPLNTLLCFDPVSGPDHLGEGAGQARLIYTLRTHSEKYKKLKACFARFQVQSCR